VVTTQTIEAVNFMYLSISQDPQLGAYHRDYLLKKELKLFQKPPLPAAESLLPSE
jgi:hypothetical protein